MNVALMAEIARLIRNGHRTYDVCEDGERRRTVHHGDGETAAAILALLHLEPDACPSTFGRESPKHNYILVDKSSDGGAPYWLCSKCGDRQTELIR